MKCKHFTCHSCQDPEVAELVRERDEARAEVERLQAFAVKRERAQSVGDANGGRAMNVTFRGGFVEDESGAKWWSAELLAKVEKERDEARAEIEALKYPRAYLPPGEERSLALSAIMISQAETEIRTLKAEVERLRGLFTPDGVPYTRGTNK